MKITNTLPTDWRDLENRVCELLNQAGYIAENKKTINTVRGCVNVDVLATSENELIRKFICECKHWNTPVSKEKIHAFRTVVHDSGSMVGILISKSGFQSGAIEAAYCSNVLLKSWDEFLELIEKQWVINQIKILQTIASPLSVYTDPLDVPLDKMTEKEIVKYYELTEKCLEAYLLSRVLNWNNYLEDSIKVHFQEFIALDNLLEYLKSIIVSTINEYKELFKEVQIDEWKFASNEHLLFPLMNVQKNI